MKAVHVLGRIYSQQTSLRIQTLGQGQLQQNSVHISPGIEFGNEPQQLFLRNIRRQTGINGDAFFIVQSGGETFFTRSGALGVDANGTLYCTSNGATVMGWQADANGNIIKDTVSPLSVMSVDKMTSAPSATTKVTLSGNIDQNDKQVAFDDTGAGYPVTVSFYDNLGNSFMAKLNLMQTGADASNTYTVSFSDLVDSAGNSALYTVDYDASKYIFCVNLFFSTIFFVSFIVSFFFSDFCIFIFIFTF